MGIELVVFATIFTLIVLLTGGPGNGAYQIHVACDSDIPTDGSDGLVDHVP